MEEAEEEAEKEAEEEEAEEAEAVPSSPVCNKFSKGWSSYSSSERGAIHKGLA